MTANRSLFSFFRSWRHRDGGRVVQVFGRRWKLEVWWAIRRRNRWGVREPFGATLNIYEAEDA